MVKTISAQVISFKREEKSNWEQGVAVIDAGNDSVEAIIDASFNKLATVWNFTLEPEKGCFVFIKD
jgi:hypothetical protein